MVPLGVGKMQRSITLRDQDYHIVKPCLDRIDIRFAEFVSGVVSMLADDLTRVDCNDPLAVRSVYNDFMDRQRKK